MEIYYRLMETYALDAGKALECRRVAQMFKAIWKRRRYGVRHGLLSAGADVPEPRRANVWFWSRLQRLNLVNKLVGLDRPPKDCLEVI